MINDNEYFFYGLFDETVKSHFNFGETKNTPPFEDVFNLTPYFYDIMKEDNVDLFLQMINEDLNGESIYLFIAAALNCVNLSYYFMTKNIGIYYISKERTSPLTFFAFFNNYELVCIYLESISPNLFIAHMMDSSFTMPYSYSISREIKQKIVQTIFINTSVNDKYRFSSKKMGKKSDKISYLLTPGEFNPVVIKSMNSYVEQINENAIFSKITRHYPEIIPKFYFCIEDIFMIEKTEYDLDEIYEYLSEEQMLQIFLNLVENLNKLNNLGYIHCDIKPTNIVIDLHGKVKLIDFGISKFIGIHPSDEMINEAITTKYFQPPEKISLLDQYPYLRKMYAFVGKPLVDSKELRFNYDIFSLGCTMMFCIEKFGGIFFSHEGQIYDIGKEEITPHDLNTSETLKNYVTECLEFDYTKRKNAHQILYPNKRIQSFEDVHISQNPHNRFYFYHDKINFSDVLNFHTIFNNNASLLIGYEKPKSRLKSHHFQSLFKWLIEVNLKTCKNYDIFINTLLLVYKYVSLNNCTIPYFQLIGICCHNILCIHYDEVGMSAEKISEICDNAYGENDVHEMMQKIIPILQKYEMLAIKSVISYFTQKQEIAEILYRDIILFLIYDHGEKVVLRRLMFNILIVNKIDPLDYEKYKDESLIQRIKMTKKDVEYLDLFIKYV